MCEGEVYKERNQNRTPLDQDLLHRFYHSTSSTSPSLMHKYYSPHKQWNMFRTNFILMLNVLWLWRSISGDSSAFFIAQRSPQNNESLQLFITANDAWNEQAERRKWFSLWFLQERIHLINIIDHKIILFPSWIPIKQWKLTQGKAFLVSWAH